MAGRCAVYGDSQMKSKDSNTPNLRRFAVSGRESDTKQLLYDITAGVLFADNMEEGKKICASYITGKA